MDLYLLTAAALVLGSILLTPIPARVGAPLLLFLLIGMLAGEDGPGNYHFDDFNLAYNIGSIALAIILFSGGLDTSKEAIRKAAGPAFALATVGVVLTSALVGGMVAWLSQIVMFLMFALLVTPSDLGATLAPALMIGAILMFIARPMAVFLCLLPFGFRPREHLYVGWVGLRGAVPIFLAIIPVISPGPVTLRNLIGITFSTSSRDESRSSSHPGTHLGVVRELAFALW